MDTVHFTPYKGGFSPLGSKLLRITDDPRAGRLMHKPESRISSLVHGVYVTEYCASRRVERRLCFAYYSRRVQWVPTNNVK